MGKVPKKTAKVEKGGSKTNARGPLTLRETLVGQGNLAGQQIKVETTEDVAE